MENPETTNEVNDFDDVGFWDEQVQDISPQAAVEWLNYMGFSRLDGWEYGRYYHHVVSIAVFMPEEFIKWKTLRRLTK